MGIPKDNHLETYKIQSYILKCKIKLDGKYFRSPNIFTFCLCFLAITLKNGTSETIYIKNCGKTLDYHATGCLHVDNSDDEISYAGSLCYCETDNCNTNFDKNSASDTIVNVITVVVSLATSMILMK